MQQGINIEDVRKYNASLREYKDKSAKLRAEIEFNQQELVRQCKELSTELGIEVTPENVQEILEQRISKIQSTMAVGTDILNRIKAEEMRGASTQPGAVNQTIEVTASNMAAPGVGVGVGAAPPVPGVPTAPSAPSAPSGQQLAWPGDSAASIAPGQPDFGELPPIFNR